MGETINNRISRHFTTVLGMSPDDLPELFAVTRTSLSQGLADLSSALAGGKPEDAARAAHTLKGNLRNLGLEEFSTLARDIERAARDNNLEGLEGPLKAIEDGIAEILKPGT